MEFDKMTVGQRLRYLRDSKLKISMETFGEKIAMSRSGVSNLENDKRTVTAKTLKVIYNAFGVNELWLKEGVGEIFYIHEGITLDEYAKRKGATPLELEIMKSFLDISPTERKLVIPTFKSLLDMMKNLEIAESNFRDSVNNTQEDELTNHEQKEKAPMTNRTLAKIQEYKNNAPAGMAYRVARSKSHTDGEWVERDEKRTEKFKNAPRVTSDDDL